MRARTAPAAGRRRIGRRRLGEWWRGHLSRRGVYRRLDLLAEEVSGGRGEGGPVRRPGGWAAAASAWWWYARRRRRVEQWKRLRRAQGLPPMLSRPEVVCLLDDVELQVLVLRERARTAESPEATQGYLVMADVLERDAEKLGTMLALLDEIEERQRAEAQERAYLARWRRAYPNASDAELLDLWLASLGTR